VIFSVIAVIIVVTITTVLVIIVVVKKKKRVNSSIQQTPLAAPVCDTIDDLVLSNNELKDPIYHEVSHNKHTITSTDKVLHEQVSSPSHTTNDVELQQNPAYATSDKVIMDDNPAYQVISAVQC